MPKVLEANQFVSFAVMLLLVVAIIAGQAGATARDQDAVAAPFSQAIFEPRQSHRFDGDFNAGLGAAALKVSIEVAGEVAGDLSYFRGEDE